MTLNDNLDGPFTYLRNRKGANNPTAVNLRLNENAKKKLSMGINSIFFEKKPFFNFRKLLCWLLILSLAVFLIVLFAKTQRSVFTAQKGQNTLHSNSQTLVHNESSAKICEKMARESSHIIKNVSLESTPKKKEFGNKKSPPYIKPKLKPVKPDFSEKQINSFVEELSSELRKIRDIETYRVKKHLTERNVKMGFQTVFLDSSAKSDIERLFTETHKISKKAEKLHKNYQLANSGAQSLNEKQTRLIQVVQNLSDNFDDFSAREKDLRKVSEFLMKLKEERNFLLDQISDIKIQIENANKNIHKNSELKETLDLEKEIIRRNSLKLQKETAFFEGQIRLFRKDITEEESHIQSARLENSQNALRKSSLLEKKKNLSREMEQLEAVVRSEERDLQRLKLKLKEISLTLKTMESFEELLESLRSEMDGYAAENRGSLQTSLEVERRKNITMKEKEEVIRKIKKFTENAIESLENIFVDKADNFDNLRDILLTEKGRIEKEIESQNDSLKGKRAALSEVVAELKRIEKEILSLIDEQNVSMQIKRIERLQREIESAESQLIETQTKLEAAVAKSRRQSELVADQNQKLSVLKNEKTNLEEKLKSKAKELREREIKLTEFAETKRKDVASFRALIQRINSLETSTNRQKEEILRETKALEETFSAVKSQKARLQALLCAHQTHFAANSTAK